jgi:hypothetical protein
MNCTVHVFNHMLIERKIWKVWSQNYVYIAIAREIKASCCCLISRRNNNNIADRSRHDCKGQRLIVLGLVLVKPSTLMEAHETENEPESSGLDTQSAATLSVCNPSCAINRGHGLERGSLQCRYSCLDTQSAATPSVCSPSCAINRSHGLERGSL